MIERSGVASPRFTARMAGLFYLLTMLAGGLAASARRGLIVAGHALPQPTFEFVSSLRSYPS